MMATRRLVLAFSLLLFPAEATSRDAPRKTLSLGNTLVRRTFALEEGVWRTISFAGGEGEAVAPVESDEFVIRLMDGRELTAADYVVEGSGMPESRALRSGTAGREMTIAYVPRGELAAGAPKRVVVHYTLRDGEAWTRKKLVLEMEEGQAVDRLTVERFTTSLPCAGGGRGEPIFIGSRCFVGLEYPAAEARQEGGRIELAHFPGRARADAGADRFVVRSKTAVAAVCPVGLDLRLFFNDYLDTIRVPPRNLLQYNSWYDLRGKEVTPSRLLEICRGYEQNLSKPYGVRLDALVPDDGYQERKSVWVPRKADYPEGLTPLRRAVESMGSRLGIWCPFDGFNLDIDWGEARGLERASVGGRKKSYYCLAGARYGKAIRGALERLITQGDLGYMKHDFNFLACDAPGHGHLPDQHHGFEANLDAEIDLLAFERDVQPDIFLNVTSCVWHSPWWLMYADTIWMCAGDLGFENRWPQISSRAWETSYRDVHFHRVLIEQEHLVPVSAYMTHGIIFGNYARVGGPEETAREWSDAVAIYYGRGVQLKELYVNPDLLAPEWWQALGESTRWAVAEAPQLERSVLFGGRPERGETYGYMHWSGERGILVARNPDLEEKPIAVPFDQSVGFRGRAGEAYRYRVIYPFFEEQPEKLTSGKAFSLSVPGDSVRIYEFLAGAPVGEAAPRAAEPVHWSVESAGKAGRLALRLTVPAEEMSLCALRLLIRSTVLPEGVPAVRIEGTPSALHLRSADGPDWSLREIDLRARRGREVVLHVESPAGARALFTPSFTMDVWWVADRVVKRPVPPDGLVLPRLIAQESVRQTVRLAEGIPFPAPEPPNRPITRQDLARIRAASLRLLVFDVNSGPHFGKKAIFLDGRKLAPVPANTRGLSVWQEKMIGLSAEQLAWIKLHNTIQLDNADGDYYKVKGFSLAIQLQDGTWIRTAIDPGVYSSVTPWAYAEGERFEKGRSPVIELEF